MNRRSVLFAAVLAVMSLAGSATQAAGVLVIQDSGTLGGFKLTNLGITGGVTSLELDLLDTSQHLDTINGAGVPNDANAKAAFVQPIFLSLTPSGGPANSYTVSLTPSTYMKTYGTGAASASMTYNLSAALAPTALPNFLNLSGVITALLTNANPAYDFSRFGEATLARTMNITLTATSFSPSPGVGSFAAVISTVGASATGSGSFSQQAVPEPASMALMGIGMSCFFAYRRFFKRRTTVA
jgi:hypothetical protein